MSPSLVLLFGLAAQAPEAVPSWLTFDIANPATIGGHRILHLDDVVGRSQRRVPNLRSFRVVLIFTASPEDCPGGPNSSKRADLCARMARMAVLPASKGSLFVGVVLSKRETAEVDRGRLLRADYPYPVMVDEHGLLRRALRADRPGVILVVDSNLGGLRLDPPSRVTPAARDRHLGEVQAALSRALEREKED